MDTKDTSERRPGMNSGRITRTLLEVGIGLGSTLVGVSALLYVLNRGKATHTDASPPRAVAQTTARADFQITQLGTFRRDQFLVDKASGRVWQPVCLGKVSGPDCQGQTIWDEMYVTDVTPDSTVAAAAYRSALMGDIGRK